MAKGVKTGGGSRKGIPNKDVALGREAIARFVDQNAERMQGWLDQIAADNPEKAFNCVRDLLEYHIPKLQRQESQLLDRNGEPTDPADNLLTWLAEKNKLSKQEVKDGE